MDYKLPQAIAVGPKRTGTTWLHDNLAGQVGLPAGVKETHFFDRFYHRGIEWYARHFAHCNGDLPILEVAPSYFAAPEAPARIADHIPDCRIIFTLRRPVDRAYSLYRLYRIYGETKLSFEDAWETIPELQESNRYVHHLTAWQKTFDRDRVLLMIFDDLQRDPRNYLKRICEFIGFPEFRFSEVALKPPARETLARNGHLAYLGEQLGFLLRYFQAYKVLNALKGWGLRKLLFEGGGDLPPMSMATANRLQAYFRPEVEALEKLSGRDLSRWK